MLITSFEKIKTAFILSLYMAIPSIAKRRINIALQSNETLRKTHNSMSYNTADLHFQGKITIFFVLIAKKLPFIIKLY